MDCKGMKANARKAYKRHYWMIVVICLFASVFGVAYSSSTWSVNASSPSATVQEDGTAQSDNVSKVLENLLVGDESQARRQVEHNQEQIVQNDTNAMMGRKRGVFASLLNSFSSGSVILSMADAANSIVHNDGVAVAVPIVVSLAVYLFVWLFVQQTYRVVMMRMLLEGRTYDKLPVSRFLYPITTRKWLSMAKVMLLENVFLFLWTFTIIGAFIKPYSYRMVPYIVAENPNIGAREAISLSRRMMKGHKWECFVADLSFLGWWLLNLFTLGLSGIFYSNGYNAAFFVEYYVHVRGLSKDSGLEGSELLSDEYLYSKASAETLHAAYGDVAETVEQLSSNLVPVDKPNGFVGFLSEWLGVRILHARSVTKYEEYREQLHQIDTGREILDGAIYPGRLAPAPMAFRFRESRTVSSDRSYSLVNLVMMFFIFCFVGLGMGGEPRLHFRRNVRESWHAAWAMAADLWHRRSDYPYSAEEVEEEALVRVPGRHGLVWRVGVLLVLVSGEDPRRTTLVGLHRLFSQSQWSYLCRGSADVWFGRFGDRVSAGSCIGQLAESYRYKKAHRCGRRASGVLLCGPGVFGAASEHWCRHHRLQGVGHIASIVAPIRCDA